MTQHKIDNSFGKIFTAAGLGTIALFYSIGWLLVFQLAQAKAIYCQRTEPAPGTCEIKTIKSPFQWETNTDSFPLAKLRGADVESMQSRSSSGSTYRVLLLTDMGEIPLTDYYSSGRRAKVVIADRINTFVNDPTQSTLEAQQDDRWILYLIGGMFFAVSTIVGVTFLWIGINQLTQKVDSAP